MHNALGSAGLVAAVIRCTPQTSSPMTYALEAVLYLAGDISGGSYPGKLVACRPPEG